MTLLRCIEGLPVQQLNIAVIGGKELGSSAEQMARFIGQEVASSGMNLVTGGRSGAGEEASHGAYEACMKMRIDPSGRIFSLTPKGETPDHKLGSWLHVGSNKLERQIALVQNSRGAIVIGGGVGTSSEIHIAVMEAIMEGYFLIPVSGTGGEADRICSKIPKFKNPVLRDTNPSPEKARQVVLSILNGCWYCDINPKEAHDKWLGSSDASPEKSALAKKMQKIRHNYF